MSNSQAALQALQIVKVLENRRNSKYPGNPARAVENPPDENGNPSWQTFCPCHEDVNTPSLAVSFSDKVLIHCRSNCANDAVIQKLKDLGLWRVQTKKPRLTVNNPAHAELEDEFLQTLTLDDKGSTAEVVYSYRTIDNKPAFWVLRNSSVRPKIIRPLSSVTDAESGENFFHLMAWGPGRPMYNLPSIRRPGPVLVLEGEKACDAAMEHFPDMVCVSWAGGCAAVHQTDWTPLNGRDVILCPDNDKPGIKAMEEIAKRLFAGNRSARISMTLRSVTPVVPQGWDFADVEPGHDFPPKLVSEAQKLDPKEISGALILDQETAFADFDARLIPVQVGSEVLLIDHTRPGKGSNPLVPFVNYPLGSTACRVRENAVIIIDKRQVPAIDLWAQGVADRTLDDFIYQPSTMERHVDVRGARMFNTFMGFPYKPEPGDKHKLFLDHAYLLLGHDAAEWVLDWFAHIIQFPQVKPGTFLLVKGISQGTGKSALGDLFRHTLGDDNANAITPANFKSDFNGFMANKLLLYIDEFNLAGRRNAKQMEEVRSLITSETVQINEKGLRLRKELSYLRVMGTTNSIVPYNLDIDARRDSVIEARSHSYARNVEYFGRFYNAIGDAATMRNWAHFLATRKITNDVRQAYRTRARDRMTSPQDPVANFLYDILCEGELPSEFGIASLKGMSNHAEAAKWPHQACLLPRGLVNEYIARRHGISDTGHSITIRMKELMGDEAVPRMKVRFDIHDGDGTASRTPHNVYQFLPILVLRDNFVKAYGRAIDWPDPPHPEEDHTNVVKLGAAGGKDVF